MKNGENSDLAVNDNKVSIILIIIEKRTCRLTWNYDVPILLFALFALKIGITRSGLKT